MHVTGQNSVWHESQCHMMYCSRSLSYRMAVHPADCRSFAHRQKSPDTDGLPSGLHRLNRDPFTRTNLLGRLFSHTNDCWTRQQTALAWWNIVELPGQVNLCSKEGRERPQFQDIRLPCTPVLSRPTLDIMSSRDACTIDIAVTNAHTGEKKWLVVGADYTTAKDTINEFIRSQAGTLSKPAYLDEEHLIDMPWPAGYTLSAFRRDTTNLGHLARGRNLVYGERKHHEPQSQPCPH